MKFSRTVAVVAGLALVGAALVAAAPASAQSGSYPNSPSLTTPDNPTDLDITSLDMERATTAVNLTMHVENLPDDNYTVVGEFLPNGQDINSADAVIITSSKVNGQIMPLDVQKRVGGVPTTLNVAAASTIGSGLARLSVSPSAIFWAGDTWGGGRITVGAVTKFVGYSVGGGVGGFGPVNENIPTSTTTTIALSGPQQVYGQTSVTLTGTLTPAADGQLEVFDGDTSIAKVAVVSTTAATSVALPNTLAIGNHALRAVYTPSSTRFAGSSSASLALRVVDPNAATPPAPSTKAPVATSTKLTLSKSKQHYKGKAAKVTVKVSGRHAGKARIYDGTHKVKTLKLVGGKATYTLSSKLKRGNHVLKVVYVPKHPASVASSTSKKVTLKVVK